MRKKMGAKIVAFGLSAFMLLGLTACSGSADPSNADSGEGGENELHEITLQVGSDSALVGLEEVCKLAESEIGIKVDIEYTVAGTDTDNLIKTRLSTGDLADVLVYSPGALLMTLNPSEHFINLSEYGFVDKLDETYKSAVSDDNGVYGVPMGTTRAGAVMYNKNLYDELGLEVPKTWDEFLSNCDKIEAAGKNAIICTMGTSYTIQVPVLGDMYNVLADNPDFISEFEKGEVGFANIPEGVTSFQKLADTVPYYQDGYTAATYDDGCEMLVSGDYGHWIMLTSALTNIRSLYSDNINDIGVFAIPGDDPENVGITAWMPNGLYGNKDSDKQEDIVKFLEFFVSEKAVETYLANDAVTGPLCVKGVEYPENTPEAVTNDMQSYYDSGKVSLAQEFLTQVKGSATTEVCSSLITGQYNVEQAAEAYDDDCWKQAEQLGIK